MAYRNTRHNLGFMALDALLEKKAKFRKDIKSNSLVAALTLEAGKVLFCKPQTYMNLSGDAVLSIMRLGNIKAEDILVVCDDINLGLGSFRLRAKGGWGGHKGLESVIKALKSENFARLRIGASSGGYKKEDLSAYVLERFSRHELKALEGCVNTAGSIIKSWLECGIEKTMGRFNTKTQAGPRQINL